MNKIAIAFLAVVAYGCNSGNTSKSIKVTQPVEHITATKDQQDRRNRSEAYCKRYNIPVYSNPNALFVEPESEVVIRTKDEVVDRALALCYMGVKSEGLEQEYLDKFDKAFNISPKLSPKEKSYATAVHPTEQQKIDANWRYEGLHIMLWALGYIDSLSYPNQVCNVADDVKIINTLKYEAFRQQAKLRTKQEILDQADLILRLHWACVSARVANKPFPGGLDNSVVMERHYALNWLIKYMDQAWDDVETNT